MHSFRWYTTGLPFWIDESNNGSVYTKVCSSVVSKSTRQNHFAWEFPILHASIRIQQVYRLTWNELFPWMTFTVLLSCSQYTTWFSLRHTLGAMRIINLGHVWKYSDTTPTKACLVMKLIDADCFRHVTVNFLLSFVLADRRFTYGQSYHFNQDYPTFTGPRVMQKSREGEELDTVSNFYRIRRKNVWDHLV